MRSGFEKTIATQLKAKGVSYGYETVTLGYTKKCKYKPDFVLPNGTLIECKGRFLSSDRTKMLRVREENPGIDLRIVFMQDNWLTKNKLQRYSDWAEKHGFKWAIGEIPNNWLPKETPRNKRTTTKSRRPRSTRKNTRGTFRGSQTK